MNTLIEQARAEYGTILPCGGKTFEESFTTEPGVGRLFWFNSADGNTHVVIDRGAA